MMKLIIRCIWAILFIIIIISCRQPLGIDPPYTDDDTTEIEDDPPLGFNPIETSSGIEINDGVFIISRDEVNSNIIEKIENTENSISYIFSKEVVISQKVSFSPNTRVIIWDELGLGNLIYIESSESGGHGFWGIVTEIIDDTDHYMVTIKQEMIEDVFELVGPIAFSEPISNISFEVDLNYFDNISVGDISFLNDFRLVLKYTNIQFYFYYDYLNNELEYFLEYDYETDIYAEIGYSASSPVFSHKFRIPPIVAGPFTLSLFPYVGIDIDSSVSGEINSKAVDHVKSHYKLINGELVEQRGADPFEPLGNVVNTPTLSGQASIVAKAGLELNLLFLDCLGPYYQAEGYAETSLNFVTSSRISDTYPEVLFGVKGNLGVKLEFFDSLQRLAKVDLPGISLSKSFDYYKHYFYPLNGAPSNLKGKHISGNNILEWDSPRSDITTFIIQKTIEGKTYDEGSVIRIPSTQTQYTDNNVEQGLNYFYRIQSEKADLNGITFTNWSDEEMIYAFDISEEYDISQVFPGSWYCLEPFEEDSDLSLSVDQISNGVYDSYSFTYKNDLYSESNREWYRDNLNPSILTITDKVTSNTYRGQWDVGNTTLYPEIVLTSESTAQIVVYSDANYSVVHVHPLGKSYIMSFNKSYIELGIPQNYPNSLPGALTSLTINKTDETGLGLSWDETAKATRYGILRWDYISNEWILVDIVSSNTYYDEPLEPDTFYSYEVLAGNADGWGVGSYIGGYTATSNEYLTSPNPAFGPDDIEVNTIGIYYSGNSTSNMGHPVEYRFEWGDGTFSEWSSSNSATHQWLARGHYNIVVHSRCSIHNDLVYSSNPYVVKVYTRGTVANSNTISVPISDYSQKSIDVGIPGPLPPTSEITGVYIEYGIYHTYPGDLDIWITYDDGQWHDYMLFEAGELGSTDNVFPPGESIYNWNGAYPVQLWQLCVRDNAQGDEGSIAFFNIQINYKYY